jgi:hypothetical protein
MTAKSISVSLSTVAGKVFFVGFLVCRFWCSGGALLDRRNVRMLDVSDTTTCGKL